MAEYQMVEVSVISAQNLKDVKLIGKMHSYVVAWVDPRSKFSSQIDKDGGTSPVWNEKLVIPVEQRLIDQTLGMLTLEICCHGSLRIKKVGFVQIPMAEIKSMAGKGSAERKTYAVRRPSGKTHGSLTISVAFGERITVPYPSNSAGKGQPTTAFPAYSQPPPYNQRPYNFPPAYGQYPYAGYPPQQPYYSAPPPPPGRNRFGGAGAGLAGGLLGGFLLGDLIGSASAWDGGDYGGYDGGGDYGGYDGGGGGDYGGYDSGGGDFGGGDFGGGDFSGGGF